MAKRKSAFTVSRDNDTLLHMLGSFLVSWSRYESILDAAIIRRLGVNQVKGAIVVSGLMIARKLSILRALLNLEGIGPHAALGTIEKIMQAAKRNTLMHATIGLSDGTLEFVKIETEKKLDSKVETYDSERFAVAINAMNNLMDDLMNQLSVSERDRMANSKIGRSLAAKSSTCGSIKPSTIKPILSARHSK